MPSFTTILAASAVAGITLANPVPIPAGASAPKSFVVKQGPSKPGLAGPVAYQKALGKYNAVVPQNVAAAAAGASSGSVAATPEAYDSEYLCPVTIGGQTLNLDFDTGSADLWVFSSELPSAQRTGHDYYTPSKSTTSKKLSGYTWKISYGDGSGASGDVYTDNVSVGGVTVTAQAVEAAQTISAQFQQDTDNDGLLGLAFSSINTVRPTAQKTFFDTAIAQKVLAAPLFTVDLKKGKPGSYTFGAIDSTKYTGSIAYTSVNKANGFWEFISSGYAVGSGSFKATSIDGIADTGTTLLLLPDSVVSAYYAQVKGSSYDNTNGGYVFPCSATLPSFTVGVGSARFVVPGSYINYAPVTSTSCYGGIQSNAGIGFSIYGDIFLKAVFAVFDSGNTRLGFVTKTL